MSWNPALDPGCPVDIDVDAIETPIIPRAGDVLARPRCRDHILFRVIPWTAGSRATLSAEVATLEVIHCRGPWRSFEAVEYATLEWVDWFNNRRLVEPSGTYRQPQARQTSTPLWKLTPWPRN